MTKEQIGTEFWSLSQKKDEDFYALDRDLAYQNFKKRLNDS